MTKNKTTLTDKERKAFATIGRMGGLKNAKKGKKYMSQSDSFSLLSASLYAFAFSSLMSRVSTGTSARPR